MIDSIGKYLQEMRIEKGLEIEDISHGTKLKTYILEQIENDDFDAIGDVGFTKIMIITYARYLQADTEMVNTRLIQLFDKPVEPPIKIETAKNKKTVFIPPNAIYFVLLALLIVFLAYSVYQIYQNESFSFNAIKQQLATTTETRQRATVPQDDLEPDTLWVSQRQFFHEANNIETNFEINEPIITGIRFFGIRLNQKKEPVKTVIENRDYILDKNDYVGDIIFKGNISPLNPEM